MTERAKAYSAKPNVDQRFVFGKNVPQQSIRERGGTITRVDKLTNGDYLVGVTLDEPVTVEKIQEDPDTGRREKLVHKTSLVDGLYSQRQES